MERFAAMQFSKRIATRNIDEQMALNNDRYAQRSILINQYTLLANDKILLLAVLFPHAKSICVFNGKTALALVAVNADCYFIFF